MYIAKGRKPMVRGIDVRIDTDLGATFTICVGGRSEKLILTDELSERVHRMAEVRREKPADLVRDVARLLGGIIPPEWAIDDYLRYLGAQH